MKDYLQEWCKNFNIKFSYTNNKITILSCGINKNIPIIRVHRIFRNCSETIANAIIGYFTDFEHNNDHLKTIEHYLNVNYPSMKYIIKSPNKEFREYLIKNIIPIKKNKKDDFSLHELNISHITKKDFMGQNSNIKPDETLSVSGDDLLELEILVEPIKT